MKTIFFLAMALSFNGCAHSGSVFCTRNFIEIIHQQTTTMELDNEGNIIGQDVVQSSKQTVRTKLKFLCPVPVKDNQPPPPTKKKGTMT